MIFEIEIPLKHEQILWNLLKKLLGKETAVWNSVIVTTSVIGFLMNPKSPKFMNFIILIDYLFYSGIKRRLSLRDLSWTVAYVHTF